MVNSKKRIARTKQNSFSSTEPIQYNPLYTPWWWGIASAVVVGTLSLAAICGAHRLFQIDYVGMGRRLSFYWRRVKRLIGLKRSI